jgi:MFS family permease
MTVGVTRAGLRASGTWQPLENPIFRALWIAVLFSNIGNWMETVGAQWLLVSQPNNSILVALVQTADTLPVVLIALPAGVLADVFDRRLLLIATQLFLAVVSVTLAALAAIGQLTPGVLLALTFLGGAGSGVTAPAWQAMIPDLVPRAQIRAAAILGSVSVNVGRVVGPAVAGLLIAGIGVAPVFALNAASFLFFAAVLLWAHVSRQVAPSRRERFLPALRAGGGYVRWSPFVRRVLIRAALFLLPATAVWALLPLVATETLHLDAAGYGLLLGALGLGAIGGVLVLGTLHARFSDDGLLALAGLAYAATMAVLVLVPLVSVAFAVLIVAGMSWLIVLSTINATLQTFLPGWVRARGLAFYLIVLFGSQALGAAIWGVVAGQVGVTATFVAAGIAMVAATLFGRRWRLPDVSGLDRSPTLYWPEVTLAFEPDAEAGPVLVTAAYTVPATSSEAFVRVMSDLERSRRRTGASDWQLYRDGADPQRFLEVFEVPSWDTHLRQHGGRLTGADAAIEGRADALASGPSIVHHYFPADDVPVDRSREDEGIKEGSGAANVDQPDAPSSDNRPSTGSSDTTS